MNTKELSQLLIGTILIVILFIGFSTISEQMQALGAAAPLYRVDFYADHNTRPTTTPRPTATATATATLTPTPTPAPTSALITSMDGGTLYSNDSDHSVVVQFAPGSLPTDSYVTYAHESPQFVRSLGHVNRFFSLSARRASDPPGQIYNPIFQNPVTITVQYPSHNVMISGTSHLYWLDGTDWVTSGLTVIRRESNFLQALTNHFSIFAVLGDTNHVYLPLILKF